MKNFTSLIKKSLLTSLFSIIALFAFTTSAQAAQVPYQPGDNLPSFETPVFNTYTNVPNGVNNEADFVRVRQSTGDPTDNGPNGSRNALFTNKIAVPCAVGAKYDIRTYIHNGADADFNNNGTGSAVAKGVKLAMSAPLNQNGTSFEFDSTISASNAASVSDNAMILCDNNVQLKLVPQSVKIFTRALGYNTLADGAVNGTTPIGSNVLGSGDVWGCWDSRIIVVYVVEVVEATPEPTATCDLLTAIALNDRKYRFTTETTVKNGATISGYEYDFGDGTKTTSQTKTVEHEYAKAGTYTATVTAIVTVAPNKGGTATSEACKVKVTIADKPVYTCDQFTLTLVKDRTYKFEVKTTAAGGATVKGYEYNFGDGSAVVKTDKSTVEHTYTKDGSFTATTTVVFTVNGEEKRVTNTNCQKVVKIDAKTPMCELPGKGHLPKDSPECKVAGVTTLPKTGAGSIVGLMSIVTVAGAALHRRMTLRRNS